MTGYICMFKRAAAKIKRPTLQAKWLIAGLTALAIFGACGGVLAFQAIAGDSNTSYMRTGSAWYVWSALLLSTMPLLVVCANGVRRFHDSTSHRRRARSVAHVQASLLRKS